MEEEKGVNETVWDPYWNIKCSESSGVCGYREEVSYLYIIEVSD